MAKTQVIPKLENWYKRSIFNQQELHDLKQAEWFISYPRICNSPYMRTYYSALVKPGEINISIDQSSVHDKVQDFVWMTFGNNTNNLKNFVAYLNELVYYLECTGYDFGNEDTFLFACPPNVSKNETLEYQKEICKQTFEKCYKYELCNRSRGNI